MDGPHVGRVLLGVVLALFLAQAAFRAAAHLLNDGTYVSTGRWPQQGQVTLVLGNGPPAASPHEKPVPIASLAKVMAAYLTLERYPFSGAQDGFTMTVTATQAEVQDAAQDQSVVAVQAGEQLTERQLLEVLLEPSAGEAAEQLVGSVAPTIPRAR